MPRFISGLHETELSLTQGGPLYKLERFLNLLEAKRVGARVVLAVVLFTWLPLVLLSLPTRFAEGTWDPLLRRTEVHVRLLLSLVLFMAGEWVLEQRGRKVTQYLAQEAIVPAPQGATWQRALCAVQRLRDAWAPELLLIVAVYAVSFMAREGWLPSWVMRWLAPTLHQSAARWEHITPTALWYMVLSQPFFLFVLLRWVLRWVLFAKLMFQLSRLTPRIVPSHADGVGGLSFLRMPLYALRYVAAGSAFAFMSVWLDEMAQNQADLGVFAHDFVVFLSLSMLLAISPYVGFMRALIKQRQHAFLAYSALLNRYTQAFDARWLGPPGTRQQTASSILGHPDFSAFADLDSVFGTVASMRTIIPNGSDLRAHLIASVAPFSFLLVLYGDSTAVLLKRALMRFIGM